MIKKAFFSIFFLLILISTGNSQSIQKITGRITNLKDSTSVSYAHIGILGSSIGTISNKNGDFEIKGNFNPDQDTLMISHIEYKMQCIPLKMLTANKNQIQLKRNQYILADVIVMPEEEKNKIIKNVIDNISRNYSNELYQSKAFYREIQYDKKTKTYSRLIEAALTIQDEKVTAPISKIKCSIQQLRKSNNYTDVHAGCKRLINSFDTPLPNQLHVLLRDNPIRSYKATKYSGLHNDLRFIYEKKLDQLKLIGIIHENDESVYVLQYSNRDDTSTFYVNKSNYALLKCEHKLESKTALIYQRTYLFKQIGDKYYPAFFNYESISDIRSNKGSLGYTINSLTFVDHNLNKKTFKRIAYKDVIPKHIDLYDIEMEYDQNFWANYNIMLEDPIDDKVISDLEKQNSLQKQFKENARVK